MAIPLPGSQVRGSRTGRPIMALLDLLGRRWALRIVWSLGEGPRNFRELQAECDGMSPSVLNRRLAELREAGIVELTERGYSLTLLGAELVEALTPMKAWSKRWAKRLAR